MISASSTLIETFVLDDVNVALKWDQWIDKLEQFFKAKGYTVEKHNKKMTSAMLVLYNVSKEEDMSSRKIMVKVVAKMMAKLMVNQANRLHILSLLHQV